MYMGFKLSQARYLYEFQIESDTFCGNSNETPWWD
jgi:hypothetical protein